LFFTSNNKKHSTFNDTMISPKLAILMATMAVIGAGALPMAPLALAQDQEADVEIERNNEISQSIEQSQEACTNEADVSVSDDDEIDIGSENEVEVEQVNDCVVTQTQTATNTAAIVDESTNDIDIGIQLSDLPIDIPPPPANCLAAGGIPIWIPGSGWVCFGGPD
jgi:hypothetical protein